MEPHDASTGGFPPWVSLEYRHMLSLVGASPATPPSSVLFSSLSAASIDTLQKQLEAPLENGVNAAPFELASGAVRDVMARDGVDLSRVCLLDPRAEKEISPEDSEHFDWFLSAARFCFCGRNVAGLTPTGACLQVRRHPRRRPTAG